MERLTILGARLRSHWSWRCWRRSSSSRAKPSAATSGGWSNLGHGATATTPPLNGTVETFTSVGTTLYVGGDFIDAGGLPKADHIANVERVQLGCARQRSRRHGQRRLYDRARPHDRQGVRGRLVPERRWRHPGGPHRGVQRDDLDIPVPHRTQRARLRVPDHRSNVVRGRWLRQRRRCDCGGRHRRLQHRHRGMVHDHRCIR